MMRRRDVLLSSVAALSAAALPTMLAAQPSDFPNRPIRMIVPFAAGGGVDVFARLLAEKLKETKGYTVVVDNRSGASGTVGGQAVRQAAADGYTVLFSAGTHMMAQSVMKSAPYDPITDFTPIARAGEAPMLLVANELLDCLPVRQFVRAERGWAERMVGLDEAGALAFGLTAAPLDRHAPPGAILEHSPAQEALGAALGARIARDGGAALLIDYGRAVPGFGDTLQALRAHRKESPLASPGEADLTVHADFPAVLAAANAQGAATAHILTQGELLVRLGIGSRAEALARARPDKAEQIERQLERLVSPDQMGELFKVACIHSPGFVAPGFEVLS